MLVMSAYNIVDRIFIGHGVDAVALAGMTVTFPLMNLATALGVLIGVGAASRTSIHLGAGQHQTARLILGNALILTIGIGLAYIMAFALFLDDILMAFGASENSLPYAHDYMVWLLPGLLLTNLTMSFNNIQRASGYPQRAMWTMIISSVINIILTPVFIFCFDMGIAGAAIATDIAMIAAFIFVMWHFMRPDVTVHFSRGCFRLNGRIVWSVITIGAAPALVNAASMLINMMVNKALQFHGSDSALASAGIFITYTSLMVVVILGVCQGMQPILGYNYGAGLIHRLKRTYWLATMVASAICFVGTLVSLLWPDVIALAFTTDQSLIAHIDRGLRLATWAFFIVGFQIVTSNFFQSIGLAAQSIVLGLTRQVIFLIPLLMVLPDLWGIRGVWLSFPISDILATVVTAAFIIHRFRIINRMVSASGAQSDVATSALT